MNIVEALHEVAQKQPDTVGLKITRTTSNGTSAVTEKTFGEMDHEADIWATYFFENRGRFTHRNLRAVAIGSRSDRHRSRHGIEKFLQLRPQNETELFFKRSARAPALLPPKTFRRLQKGSLFIRSPET